MINERYKLINDIVSDAMQGRLSTRIMEIGDVKKMFDDFKVRASEQGFIVMPDALHHIFEFPISFFMAQNKLQIFVHLPLARELMPLKVLQFNKIPLPLDEHRKFSLMIEENNLLAVGKQHGIFTILTQYELDKCTRFSELMFCLLHFCALP